MSIQDLWRLDNKVAVLVGASGGIGAALAAALAESGARLAVVSTTQGKADQAVGQLAATGHEAAGFACDVTKREQVGAMADGVARRFGRIDLLVNTAGINLRRPAEEVSEEDWVRVLDVNLVGAFRVAQAIGRHLIAGGGGKIVTLSSTRGILGFPGGYSAYCASKAGLDMPTRQLATEWARHNVNVNAVAPTYVDTPLIAALKDDPQLYPTLVGRIPLGRFGRPADLVGAVLFLVSPASDFVTGQILYVDGGISATEFYAPAPVK